MHKDQLKQILRNAVLLALPVATQVGCVSEPVIVDPPKSTDPCREPAVRSPGQATVDEKIYLSGSDGLSAGQQDHQSHPVDTRSRLPAGPFARFALRIRQELQPTIIDFTYIPRHNFPVSNIGRLGECG